MDHLQGPRLMARTTKSPIRRNRWVPLGCRGHLGSVNFFSGDCKNLGVSSSGRNQTFWGSQIFEIPRKEIKQCAYCQSERSIALPLLIVPQYTMYVRSENVQ